MGNFGSTEIVNFSRINGGNDYMLSLNKIKIPIGGTYHHIELTRSGQDTTIKYSYKQVNSVTRNPNTGNYTFTFNQGEQMHIDTDSTYLGVLMNDIPSGSPTLYESISTMVKSADSSVEIN